jgi:thioredoxin-related protein
MKKLIIPGLALFIATGSLFFLFSMSIGTASAKIAEQPVEVRWYTLAEAQEMDSVEPRKIFLDISTSWCGWCKTMDANTFKNPIIAKYMNATYYCVKFDAETHDTIYFNGQKFWNRGAANTRSAHDFAITVLRGQLSYPSFAFISKDRMTFTIMQGYMPPDKFEPYLHYYGEEKEKTVNYADFLKTFKSELPPVDPNQQPATPAPH